jgi:hypothetical protein
MLYKLGKTNGIPDCLSPIAFGNLQLEKHLENLLADTLAGVLFEDNEVMPIFQERQQQAEADIYALNEKGDVMIFELKRGEAGPDAVYQALRYCETAAHWDFNTLQAKLTTYLVNASADLREEHKTHFGLESALDESDFNRHQHLIIVGTAGNDNLIQNVDYWKSKGLSVSFIPYRVYQLGGEEYFEFFSHPYDRHANPAHAKGVIFDTNLSYDANSIWYMIDNNRVAAFGDIQHVVNWLGRGDLVFLYHRGKGIVAAGEVSSDVKSDSSWDALYRDLRWRTNTPIKAHAFKAMPAWQIRQVTNRNFYWAKTVKVPYLSREEAETLLAAVVTTLA